MVQTPARTTSGSRAAPSVKVSVPMTITEKILARAAGRPSVRPGDNMFVNADVFMTHDVCGPVSIAIFKREFGADARVWDPERVVMIPDHYIFTADKNANRAVDILREFAREQGIRHFYDITDRSDFRANPDYKGVCHIALAQEGHCRPGEVLFGTDSHTCNAGAFGQFATGVGSTDGGFVMGTGKLLIKVPATMRFVLNGEMPDYLMAKDIILQIIGDIGLAGATYRAMEFAGDALAQFSMEERMTLCNMAIEAGGKNGVVAADDITLRYVRARTDKEFQVVHSDEDATLYADYTYDLSRLEPTVAKPHTPDNRDLARHCEHIEITRVYIGSCTGGKIEDFVAAARILRGRQVRVPTFLVPATQQIYGELETRKLGDQTLMQIFLEAGCIPPAAPSCAACLGGPKDTFGRLNGPEVVVSTTNRNFPGRMGDKSSSVFLASPYTAAASALTGRVTDPRKVYDFDRVRHAPESYAG
ncbi:hypothetical protein CDCA_CDCA17G4412 [Cyanidium caldarium]|uniref:Aconitase/3-isopropylmalate dehydratase large subunit alpha/beta/alpha domain-containing protein n=1 Tax=Cyanidium caldarium TaxID=2771 RepID=A0AAV9J1C9_CYACA|nr:hypothetical protein CDCA_CDCA17G4412 [Cyanidium caldarium]